MLYEDAMENKIQVTPDNFESFLPLIEKRIEEYAALEIESWNTRFLKSMLEGQPKGRGWEFLNSILNEGSPLEGEGYQYLLKLRDLRQSLNDQNDAKLIEQIDEVLAIIVRYHNKLGKGTIARAENLLQRGAGLDPLIELSPEQVTLFEAFQGKFKNTSHMYWHHRPGAYNTLDRIFSEMNESKNAGCVKLYKSQIDHLLDFYGGFIKKLEASKKKFSIGQLVMISKSVNFNTEDGTFSYSNRNNLTQEPFVVMIAGDVYARNYDGEQCVQILVNGKIFDVPIKYLHKPTKKELRSQFGTT